MQINNVVVQMRIFGINLELLGEIRSVVTHDGVKMLLLHEITARLVDYFFNSIRHLSICLTLWIG